MTTTFWVNNQEFELTIDTKHNLWEVFNYTKQELIKEGTIK
jgi:hypothetical protein